MTFAFFCVSASKGAFDRPCAARLQVEWYKEEGTPFDMAVLNDIDRFSLALRAAECLPEPSPRAESLRLLVREERERHRSYIRQYGEDLPEVRNWSWVSPAGAGG